MIPGDNKCPTSAETKLILKHPSLSLYLSRFYFLYLICYPVSTCFNLLHNFVEEITYKSLSLKRLLIKRDYTYKSLSINIFLIRFN